jgi:hypothetical protein
MAFEGLNGSLCCIASVLVSWGEFNSALIVSNSLREWFGLLCS